MPITTDTYRQQSRLNLIFAVSGVVFLVTTVWMMLEDNLAPWKFHQRDYQANVENMTRMELERYDSPDFKKQLDAAQADLDAKQTALETNEQFKQKTAQLRAAQAKLQGATLNYNDTNSVMAVKKQDFERAETLHGRDSVPYAAAKAELEAHARKLEQDQATKEQLEDEASGLKREVKELSKDRDASKKSLAAMQRKKDAAQAKAALNENDWTNFLRNEVLDFAVKTREVKQVVLPNVRKPLNFLDTYQIDRCQTCHIAMDRKDFTEEEAVVAMSLSIAAINGSRAEQNKEPIPLPFKLPEVPKTDAEGKPLAKEEYLKRLAKLDDERERTIRDIWDTLTLSGDRQKQKKLYDDVMAAMQTHRKEANLPELTLGHPLKAHPRLDLYVSPDSPHPVNKVGCTVCHGGNGDETSFTTAIHTADSVKQDEEWREKYEGHIDYSLAQHWWNRPMLAKKYVEASCVKCHTQAADVAMYENRPLASQITEGRQMFTQLGCINCHKVEDLDTSRRVGPDLTHISTKLKPEFVQPWVHYPRDFRPSTWMPHFFKQENNALASDLPDDPDPNPPLRTETEVAAISHWLFTFSTGYETEKIPAELAGKANVENGRQLFDKVGCLACHAAIDHKRAADGPTVGETWITEDLVHRENVESVKALHRARGMSYGEKVRYALEHLTPEKHEQMQKLRDHTQWELRKAQKLGDSEKTKRLEAELAKIHVPAAFTRFAPELSGVGSKVSIDWLFDWLRNPRHYSNYTKMPSLRLTEQEALDIGAYLLTLKNEEFKQAAFDMTPERKEMLDRLLMELLQGQNSQATARRIVNDEGGRLSTMLEKLIKSALDPAQAKAKIDSLDLQSKKLAFLGNKMINHYGCYSCHSIPGFENTTRPGTELTAWADKPIKQLDFSFFEHMFEHERGPDFEKLYPEQTGLAHLTRDGGQDEIHVGHSHSSFARHKVRNPRIWDRGKVKAAYEKLKMPNFYLTEEQSDAITTYLLSRMQPFVTKELLPPPESDLHAIAAGRNLITELNCIGCHNVEFNAANIQQFITAALPGGGAGAEEEEEEEEEKSPADAKGGAAVAKSGKQTPEQELAAIMAAHGPYDEVNGPPWLRGEGAKIQHSWLYEFLHNVRTLRPWLQIRMPSFHLTNEQATTLVQYFAAVSRHESDKLKRQLAPLDKYMDAKTVEGKDQNEKSADGRTPGDEWYREPQFKRIARFLAQYAIDNRLANPLDFAVDPNSIDAVQTFASIKKRAAFLRDLYEVHYPFVGTLATSVADTRFELGREMTIDVLDCLACHALGDPNIDGANKNPSAPSLSLAFRRLRPEWVQKWLQEPAVIQPGTKMPQWFPGQRTAFADFPNRAEMEAKFGKSGGEQIGLLMDFLYEAGQRSFTGIKRGAVPKPQAAVEPAADSAGAIAVSSESMTDSNVNNSEQ